MTAEDRPLDVLVVDDEPLARAGVRALLAEQPDVGTVREARGGAEAIAAIRERRPDLVFLDVQMPRVDGFGVIAAIGADAMPPVVFVTAYDAYAVRAFEVHALDYLLKPVDPARFRDAFARAVRAPVRDGAAALDGALRDALARLAPALQRAGGEAAALTEPASSARPFAVREKARIVFVAATDVEWVEAFGNYVRLHVRGGAVHVLRATLDDTEARLGADFVRLRRSALVRTAAIRFCEPWGKGSWVFVLRDGTRLTSSRYYRERLRGLFDE